ncbi:MAG: hypothetical protein HQK78_00270 [Desulfobacterales bacterium]|nr:hypothetical protein [Desulfobacterales bacterium]
MSDPGQNNFRIDIFYRSFGLLERHSSSALWIGLGLFAYLFIETELSRVKRAVTFALMALIIVQNFTAIFVISLVMLYLNRAFIKLRYLMMMLLLSVILIFLFDNYYIQQFMDNVLNIIKIQITSVLSFQDKEQSFSYFMLVLTEFIRYGHEIIQRPYELLLGYGLGSHPFYNTSGDIGFIESILRLGIPLWILLTWKIITLMKSAFKINRLDQDLIRNNSNVRMLKASAAILSSIWLMDIHYSVWIYKSILPILFFAMAIAHRANIQTLTVFRSDSTVG